jgi:FSR family fosmidomycin resistance protein-like MFS transporter
MALSLLSPQFNPLFSVILAGAGSALFHVGGGAIAISVTRGKASGPGIFSAPGVAGLAIGGYIALTGGFFVIPLILLLLTLGVFISFAALPEMPYAERDESIELDRHDYIMLIILFAIALRSAVWNIFQYIEHGETINIVLIGIAAMAGKIFGGFAADKLGWKNYAVTALLASIPLLVFSQSSIFLLLPGIALLQSVTPVLISAVARGLPQMPATASGLTLGFAIAAGGLPFIAGINIETINSPPVIIGSVLFVSALLLFSLNNMKYAPVHK